MYKALCGIMTAVIFTGMSASMTAMADGYTGWKEENGNQYWYENGVKQGTEGRGKEIYDPASDAWYWLDAIDGGKKATGKDVYQESEAGQWGNSEGEGGKRYGKWVRYDEKGHMIKGWNTNEKGTYYFDFIYGTMAKGDVLIGGIPCYFDEITGIASDKQWRERNGAKYWYEGGIRQGYDPDNKAYRGKEIYDPGSDAWYWLDNDAQGKMAVSKDVYQESLAGEWGAIAGPDGKRYGQWVRYDENGHMIKGWQTTDAGTYYFDLTYGTMAKGNATIGGKNYYFDIVTGILQNNEEDVDISFDWGMVLK